VTGLMLAALAVPAIAVENALGRTIPGLWVQPQMGVVPREPGLSFTLLPLGYMGSLGGTPQSPTRAPIAGKLAIDASAGISENWLIPQYAYKTEHRKIGFASALYLPISYRRVTAVNGTFISAGLGDLFFSPLKVGIHFSENHNLAIDTKIWAPSAGFEIGNLSNLGMNAWTFTPNVGHSYLWKKRGLEVDNYVAFDIYRENPTTRYKNGTVFHWDGMVFQYLSERGGFGGIISNETQLNRDQGPLADRLNGFQGGAWGAGPIVAYVARKDDPKMVLQFRWVREFHVTNLLKGNALLLGLTLTR
jgi:hypothetical protein